MKKTISRRQFFKSSLIASAFASVPNIALSANRPSLFIPPLIEVRKGRPIFLKMESVEHQFEAGKYTEVWGFNGAYLGPTIRIQKGSFAKLNYLNNLSQSVALNIQGLQASGELLGGVAKILNKGDSWSPIIPITQSASTCWYHSVSLANSAYQTYRGLAGLWIIEDEQNTNGLPKKYGVNDIPLILQDISLNKEGEQLFQNKQSALFGNQLSVNGQISPYLNVQRGWLRLRLLNASVSRNYHLRFDNDLPMFLIAQDQSFLPQGKKIQVLQLGPSERAEILLNLNQVSHSFRLIEGKQRNILNKISAFFSENELLDNTLLEIRPQGLSAVFSDDSLPALNNDSLAALQQPILQERKFHFDANSGMINDKHFDPKRIINAKRGSTERWILTTNAPLGFRIQGARFVVESINDQKIPESEIAWKDSVWIENKVSILIHFDNTSTNSHPFIFGTSNLMLADKGCFRLLVVQ